MIPRISPRILAGVVLACIFAVSAGRAAGAASEDERFQELMDRIWAWNMEQFPEWATHLGKREGLDRWTDDSYEAIQKRKEQTRLFLGELATIDAGRLNADAQLNHRLLLRDYQLWVDGQRFPGELLALNQLGGVHQGVVDLMRVVPAQRAADFDAILARLGAVPRVVDQNIGLLQRGLAAGVTPPRVTLGDVPRQLDELIAQDSIENPILAPFEKDAPLLTAEQREKYRQEGLRVFRESVLPALRKFRSFVVDAYLPGARDSLGMSELPDGEAWYAHKARGSTTTDLTPQEIHELGLKEVGRIEGELGDVMRRTGFEGDLREFGKFLRSDTQFFYASPEELLSAYRDICKRADAGLPALFGRLPRLPYGVKPVPDYAAPSKPTAYYESGSIEAGRAGYFFANTYRLNTRPKWEMEALALHEAVPGHHLQIALAREQEDKHELLREQHHTAFIEGWALYSESLGKEMEFYTDPYSDFGRLTYEMWRAVRLVIDTGLHAMGWTREQAIAFFRDHTARSDHDIKVEVDRYLVWPGQALAYKIGELRIKELRRRAEKAVGAAFDIRAFHDAILEEGSLPLEVLEERIDEWIERQRGKERASTAVRSESPN
jgi:uncharacterized protein (DUF885 family)